MTQHRSRHLVTGAILLVLAAGRGTTSAQDLRVFLTTLSEEQLSAIREYVEELADGSVLYEGDKDPRHDMLLTLRSDSYGSLAELYFRGEITLLESEGCTTGPVRVLVQPDDPVPVSVEQAILEEGGVRDPQDSSFWFIPLEALARIEELEEVDFLQVVPGHVSQAPADPLVLVGPCHEFSISASWRREGDVYSTHASGRQVARDSALFWFLEPSNIELQVKVLDTCAINGYRWVFIAGLTDLEVRIEVIHRTLPEHVSRHYSSSRRNGIRASARHSRIPVCVITCDSRHPARSRSWTLQFCSSVPRPTLFRSGRALERAAREAAPGARSEVGASVRAAGRAGASMRP